MFVEIYSSYFCRLMHTIVGSPDVEGSFCVHGFCHNFESSLACTNIPLYNDSALNLSTLFELRTRDFVLILFKGIVYLTYFLRVDKKHLKIL